MTDPLKSTVKYSRELFAHLTEFFSRATGQSAASFATVEAFSDVIRASGDLIAPRFEAAFRWLDNELRAFYGRLGGEAYTHAKQLGGMTLVLGGSSRFLKSQLHSVSTAVLYSDTVLIPDPVLPWLERERAEERFRDILLLQAVHALLHLKPLVDADLPYPAVVVFPSFEKLLEQCDAQTEAGISQLLTDVLANSLGEKLLCIEDVLSFADRHPERFCEGVDRNRLFVAPGGPISEPLQDAMQRYEREMGRWRSREWLNEYSHLPVHRKLITAVSERVTPIYHLLENAQELGGHPLMCLVQHAHYFRLVSGTGNARLAKLKVLDPRTTALVDALSSRRLQWLGRIPVDTLAKLRLDNENATFRKRLASAVGRLHESVWDDVDRVAAEVCHEIEGAIAEHDKALRTIQEKYNRTHGQTATLAVAAASAALIPALAPLLGTAVPLALAVKYGYDKASELSDKRALTQSLVGILASAERED